MTPKIDTRLLREAIDDGLEDAARARWWCPYLRDLCSYCECYACTDDTDDTDDEWAKVDPAWQWVRYAPRRWIEPVAA